MAKPALRYSIKHLVRGALPQESFRILNCLKKTNDRSLLGQRRPPQLSLRWNRRQSDRGTGPRRPREAGHPLPHLHQPLRPLRHHPRSSRSAQSQRPPAEQLPPPLESHARWCGTTLGRG